MQDRDGNDASNGPRETGGDEPPAAPPTVPRRRPRPTAECRRCDPPVTVDLAGDGTEFHAQLYGHVPLIDGGQEPAALPGLDELPVDPAGAVQAWAEELEAGAEWQGDPALDVARRMREWAAAQG